jgi:ribose transport system substrate-binding protein
VLAAQHLAKLIGYKGSVMVISFKPGVTTDELRAQGFDEGIKKYPNIKLLGIQYDNDSPSTAQSEVNSELSAHPDLAGVFSTDLFGAEGAYTASQAAAKAGKLTVVTFDATAQVLAAIRNGTVTGVVSQNPYEQGFLGAKYAIEALNGQTPPKKTLLPLQWIDKSNVNSKALARYVYTPSC